MTPVALVELLIGYRSSESEDGRQALVDPPDLLGARVSHLVAKAIYIDSSHLLDEHLGGFALDQQVWPEGGRTGTS
jgi:hypothetical protein